jgi:hypothetical protein
MEDNKGGWYLPVKPFTRDHEEDASKSLKEMNRQKDTLGGNQLGKSETIQKRVDMDLFKGGMN